jgi:PAS domain S-box-containing protein
LLAGGIVAAGSVYYRNYKKQYRAEVESQLSVIADLKVGELVQFRRERLGDASVLFRNAPFSAQVRRLLEDSRDADAQGQIQAWIGKYEAYYQYDRVSLLDSRGVERTSRRATEVLRSGLVTFQDFYRDEHNRRIYLAVLVPIFDEPAGRRRLGVLVLRIDPRAYLYPFIGHWPIPSRTAETLLVRRDGNDALFLNNLKFGTDAALNLRIPLTKGENPAANAVLGREGMVEGVDYRGVPVIAQVRRVPDAPWFLVARMDTSEVYAPLGERWWAIVGLGGVLLLSAAGAAGSVWRQQNMRFYRERYQAAEALRESERQLRQAEADAHLGHWSMDLLTGRYSGSDEMHRIYGVPLAALDLTRESLTDLIHPDDRAGRDQVLATIRREGKSEFEYRVVRPDGSLRHVAGRGELVRDAAGKAVGMFGTVLDVTELRRKERELQEKNDELARFTYAVSHDLKSPLVTVKTFLGYLELDARNQDAARMDKDLGYIRGAADKMSRLLDELLELSRVGRRMNPFVDAPLEAVVREALDLVAGRIAARGVTVRMAGEPVLLHGDRQRLVEVFQNLVDNAVKFLGDQPAPWVEIGAEPVGGEMVIYVRDNGMGIDPRHRHKLFGLFEKLNSGVEGTGIGLALARRIVEVHGGRIWAESAGPGQGATFRFTLAKTKRLPADKENQ